MKRFLAALAAFMFVFSAFSAVLPAFALKASPIFTAPTITARPGETVNVSVSLSGDYEAHGLNLWLVFSNSNLILESYSRGDVLGNVTANGGMALIDTKVENGNNSIRLGVIMPTDPFTANGVIFTAQLTVNADVPSCTVIPLDVRIEDFFYMPIGQTHQQNISHGVSDGKISVSESDPTPSPTPIPTETPNTPVPSSTPTSTPGTPTAPPSSTPGTATPTPRPSSTPTSAPGTPTPRPSATPTPIPGTTPRPSSAPNSAAPATQGAQNSPTPTPGPNETVDPFARFSASPFPSAETSPTPDGGSAEDPFGRFSPSPAPGTTATPFLTVPPYDGTLPPFDTIPPSENQLPDLPPRRTPGFGVLAAIGVGTAAIGTGLLIFARKRRGDDNK